MSKLVDERVVQMEFDNRNFEKNVKQSQQSIASLKQSLDFGKVGQSIDAVTAKFSAMDAVMFSVINRLTDKVMNFGERMVKSLSIDNITSGWDKAMEDTKTQAVLGSLSEELTGGSEAIREATKQILWYSDATSYSYNQIMDAVTKGVNAGMKLEESTDMIIGFANAVATAGQNNAVFMQAVPQLTQAFNKGWLGYQDYYQALSSKNIDTVELKTKLADAMVAVGTVNKQLTITGETIYEVAGKTYSLTELFKSGGPLSDGILTIKAFGLAMEDYGKGTKVVYQNLEKLRETNANATIDEAASLAILNGEITEAELKYFYMAQKARTLEDAVNATKDAVSSGWMQSYLTVLGDYEEATDVWTRMSDSFYDIFNSGAYKRTKLLGEWVKMTDEAGRSGRDLLLGETGIVFNLLDVVKNVVNNVKQAISDVFGVTSKGLFDATKKFQSFTERLKNFTADMSNFRSILSGFLSIFKIVGKTIFAVFKGLKPITNVLFYGANSVAGGVAKLGQGLTKIANSQKIFSNITAATTKVATGLAYALSIVIKGVQIFIGWVRKAALAARDFIIKYNVIPTIFEGIKKAAVAVWGALKIVGNWIKKTTLKVVEFIKQHDILSKAVNVMKKAFSALGKAIQFVWNILKKAVTAVADGFKKLTGMGVSQAVKKGTDKIKTSLGSLVSSVDNARQKAIEPILDDAEKSEKKLTPLQHFFKGLVEIFKGLWSIIKAVWTIIGPLLEAIGKGLQMIGENLQKAFSGDNAFSNFLNLMKVALGAGTLAIAVKVFQFFKDSMTAISDVMYAVQKRINAAAFASYAKAMKDLAIGILLIAAAIILLGTMDTAAMWKGVAAVMTILAGFAVILIVVAKIMSGQVTPAIQQATSSVAVATKTTKGFISTLKTGIKGIMDGAKNLLTSFGRAAQIQALGLMVLELAAAVFIMVIGIKMIAKLDWADIGKGMAVIGVLLVTMSGLALAISRVDGRSFKKAAKGIYALALTLVVIAKAAKMFAQMSFGDLGKAAIALAIMGGALAGISVIISQMAKVASQGFSSKQQIKGFNSMMRSFMAFAATMVVLGIVVKIISTIPMGKAFAALGLMTGLLVLLSSVIVGLALVVKYLATTNDRIKRMYALIGMFATLAAVLTVMAIAIAVIARIPWKAALMATGIIVVLLGMMLALSVVSKKSSKAAETTAKPSRLLKMAAGLVVLASSLLVFAAGLAAMAFAIGMFLKIGLMKFLDALKMIGIMLAGVAVSALVLKPVVPVIIAFGAALAIIGAAFLAMGLGMDLMVKAIPKLVELLPSLAAIMGGTFAAALLAVKENIDLIGEVMGLLFDTMLQLLATRLLQIADVIVTLLLKIIKLIQDNLDPIFKFLTILINKCLQLLIDTTPKLMEWLGTVIAGLLEILIENTPAFIKFIGTFIEELLADVADRAPRIFESLFNILLSFLDMFFIKIPELVHKANMLIVAFLDQLGRDMHEIFNALYRLLDACLNAVKDFIRKSTARLITAMFDAVVAIIEGIGDAMKKNAKRIRDAMFYLAKCMLEAFTSFWDIHSPSKRMFNLGGNLIEGLINGIEKLASRVTRVITAINKLIFAPIKGLIKEFISIGKEIMDGLLQGMQVKSDSVTSWLDFFTGGLVSGVKRFLGIKSPSRVFREIGEYVDEGLALGLNKETKTVDKAMNNVTGAVMDSVEKSNLNDAISEVFNSVTDNIDSEPTIRPVMDLSEIQNGATRLSSLMNGLSDYQVDGSVNLANRTRNEVSRNRTANMAAVNPASATPAGETTSVSNVFNITGSNAKDIADEVSQRIQQSITRNRIKYGNV